MKYILIATAIIFQSCYAQPKYKEISCGDIKPLCQTVSGEFFKKGVTEKVIMLVGLQPVILTFGEAEMKEHHNRMAMDIMLKMTRAETLAADMVLYDTKITEYMPELQQEIKDYTKNRDLFRKNFKLYLNDKGTKGYFRYKPEVHSESVYMQRDVYPISALGIKYEDLNNMWSIAEPFDTAVVVEQENTDKQPRYFLIGISLQNDEKTSFQNGFFTMYDFREDSIIAAIKRVYKDELPHMKNVVITGIFEFKSKKEMNLYRSK